MLYFIFCNRVGKIKLSRYHLLIVVLLRLQKKPVDFDDELKIGDVRYDNMT